METPDLTSQNIEKIAALFPNCVTEMRDEHGRLKHGINFEMLKQMLSPDVVDGDECYEFTWVGKKASIVEANKPIRKTLRPCPAESKDWDTTENLYIEGDNLEVLKLLQEAYLGKVKMIYIDPPYNTGSDSLVYPDSFIMDGNEYEDIVGLHDENGNILFSENNSTNPKFHSIWCSMMYSRLLLARNLLADNGFIFISIDDNEEENAKKICDEIFGASNYCGIFIVNSTPNARDYGHIGKMHEFCLFYAKNISKSESNMLPDENKMFKYHDKKGGYNIHPLYNSNEAFNKFNRPNLYYPFYVYLDEPLDAGFFKIGLKKHEGSVEVYPPKSLKNNIQFVWRWGKEKALRYMNEEIVGYEVKPGEYRIVQKMRHEEKIIRSLLIDKKYSSRRGTAEVESIMGGKIFSFPKPLSLLLDFCKVGMMSDDIVLDFFSGSATTAHAVMQLNAEERQNLELSLENLDKRDPDYQSKFQALSSQLSQTGKRKFIMVQLPEPCDEKSEAYKAGYKNICEIGKERIRRAGRQILERSFESLEKEGLIEKYAGELSEIRSLEEVYGVGSAGVSSHQAVAAGGDLRIGRPNAAGSRFDSVEYCGGTVAGNTGVYPVFASGKGITSGAGNTIVTLRSLAVLNELGYRVCLEQFRGDQQNALLPDQISKLQALNAKLSLDVGFRVLKLDDSNMKDVYYAADDYDQQNLADMISNIKEDRTDLDLLFGCLLDWGVPLSMPYTSEQIDGCTVHTYNDGDLIACFDANVPESVVKEIARRKPLRAVFRDSSFADSPAKINVFEIFKLYMPEDADDISKRVRVI